MTTPQYSFESHASAQSVSAPDSHVLGAHQHFHPTDSSLGSTVSHLVALARKEEVLLGDLKRDVELGDRDAVFRSASLLVNLGDAVAAPTGSAKSNQTKKCNT